MTTEEAIPILARWVRELQVDLDAARKRALELEDERSRLEHRVAQYAYWMRTGRRPAELVELAAHLEAVV